MLKNAHMHIHTNTHTHTHTGIHIHKKAYILNIKGYRSKLEIPFLLLRSQ
jgi:hypothetical protein